MPNHVHFIVIIDNSIQGSKRYYLSDIVGGFKTYSAKNINKIQNTTGQPFWQSRFHEHVIRNKQELIKIRQYIINNPKNWHRDRNNKSVKS